ncbi:MAG TPA: histidine kinase dimerization/phosphoacceptor domain -containing protein [Spirochaetota bacterium]|nr:histidine kinase dimerization/phosphoacceptor domain -containing protein [Spirochaetota bacterium]
MKNIMVVDDEALISTQLEERLTLMGYNVVGRASSGEESVLMAKHVLPDVILMDIVMPGEFDGIAASEIIINELEIPVIFITAYGDDKYIERAKKLNPAGYILKPFHIDEIKAAIEIAIERKFLPEKPDSIIERFRLVADSIPYGIILIDADANIIFWNKEMKYLLGFDEYDAFRKPCTFFMELSSKLAVQQVLDYFSAYDTTEKVPAEREIQGIGKSGASVSLNLCLFQLTDSPYNMTACFIRDITDKKNREKEIASALREKETLFRETTHHVKNDLQIISNLLFLQSRNIKDKNIQDLFKECSNRIQSISMVHQMLYSSKESGRIYFRDYIQCILDNLFSAYREKGLTVQLDMTVEEAFLDMKQSRSCGLIINELVTNSFKHAFSSNAGNMIFIKFFRAQNDGHYSLIIGDNGCGMPDTVNISKPMTMGLQLVRLLVMDLRGHLELTAHNSTEFTITFL